MFKVIEFEDVDSRRPLQLTISEKLVFYDASYVVTSEIVKTTLVTGDAELRENEKVHKCRALHGAT